MSNPEFDWTTILPEDERKKVLADSQTFFDSFPTRDEIEQAGREGRAAFARACATVDARKETEREMTPNYAEILRLHRKYSDRPGEPLWRVFVRIGQQLENSKPIRQRCHKCHRTDIEFERVTEGMGLIPCGDPWHADRPLG